MRNIFAAAALSLALAVPAFAQDGDTETPPPDMMPQAPSDTMEGQGAGPDMEGPDVEGPDMQGQDMQGQGRMEGHGRMRDRHGMMHGRMMERGKRHEAMMRIMMVFVDTDGSGDLSLEEVLDVHERLFNAADTDGDGSLTVEEIHAMMGMEGGR